MIDKDELLLEKICIESQLEMIELTESLIVNDEIIYESVGDGIRNVFKKIIELIKAGIEKIKKITANLVDFIKKKADYLKEKIFKKNISNNEQNKSPEKKKKNHGTLLLDTPENNSKIIKKRKEIEERDKKNEETKSDQINLHSSSIEVPYINANVVNKYINITNRTMDGDLSLMGAINRKLINGYNGQTIKSSILSGIKDDLEFITSCTEEYKVNEYTYDDFIEDLKIKNITINSSNNEMKEILDSLYLLSSSIPKGSANKFEKSLGETIRSLEALISSLERGDTSNEITKTLIESSKLYIKIINYKIDFLSYKSKYCARLISEVTEKISVIGRRISNESYSLLESCMRLI